MVKSITQPTSNKIANMALLCAVLVVSIHIAGFVPLDSSAWWLFAFGRETISHMAVPFFFVCSGFFLAMHYGEDGWYRASLLKRLRTVMIPYIVFLVAFYFAQKGIVVLSNIVHHRPVCISLVFSDNIPEVLGLVPWRMPTLRALWYCRSLMIFVLLSPLLFALISRKWGGAFILLLYVVMVLFAPWFTAIKGKVDMILVYTLSLEGLFFFAAGAFICLHGIRFPNVRSLKISAVITAVCFVVMRVVTFRYGWGLSYYFVWLAIPFCLVSTWFVMPTSRLPPFLAGSAFPIYLMHMFFLLPQGRGLSLLAPKSCFAYIGVWVLVVVCSLAATWGIRRMFPKTAALIFGGR